MEDGDVTAGALGGQTETSVLEMGPSAWMSGAPDAPRAGGAARAGEVAQGALFSPQHELFAATGDLLAAERPAVFADVRSREAKDREARARELQRVRAQQREFDDAEKERALLSLCQRYFLVGCLGLPLVHFVNVAYFYREARLRDSSIRIRHMIWLSLAVGAVQSVLWIVWFSVFQSFKDTRLLKLNILHPNVTEVLLV